MLTTVTRPEIGAAPRGQRSLYALCAAITLMVVVPEYGTGQLALYSAVVSSFLLFAAVATSGPIVIPGAVIAFIASSVPILVSTLAYGTTAQLRGLFVTGVPIALVALTACTLTPSEGRQAWRYLAGLGAFIALLAVAQKLNHGAPRAWGWLGTDGFNKLANPLWSSPSGRVPATLAHGIPLATLLVAAVLAALLLPWPGNRLLRAALVGVCSLGVLASGSRSALIVGFATLCLLLLSASTRRIVVWGQVLVVLATVWLVDRYRQSSLGIVNSLEGTGSLEHRVASWTTFSRLADRGAYEVVLGSGWNANRRLADAGLLQSRTFTAIDNNLVAIFAYGGAAALLLVVIAIALAWATVDRLNRAILLLVTGMFLSFDVVAWRSVGALLAMALAGPGALRVDSTSAQSSGKGQTREASSSNR